MTSGPRPYGEVIGDPIDHSLSPLIHCFWLKQLGIRAGYRRCRVASGGLAAYLEQRRHDPQWRGCNVTMPLKLDAVAIADEASDRAIAAGAANLIVPKDGRLFAGNTDVGAVATLLKRLIDSGAPAGLVTLLGSGGAARAVLMGLRLLGISSVRIQARNMNEAYKLAVQFGLSEEPRPFHASLEGDALINSTPLGMTGKRPLDIGIDELSADGWVFDLVTAPRDTELIKRAAGRGLSTVSGIEMLVEQAAESFAHLFGADAPREMDESLFERLAR